MTERLIISEIYLLPETLKLEVLHFIAYLKGAYAVQKQEAKPADKRVFGKNKGKYTLAPDFDEPLEDFKDYM